MTKILVAHTALIMSRTGNIKSVTDPNGMKSSFTYHTDPRFVRTVSVTGNGCDTYISGYEWEFARELKKKETDPNKNSMKYEYDTQGRLKEVWTPEDKDSPAVSYEYRRSEDGLWYSITSNKTLYDRSVSYSNPVIETVAASDGLGRVKWTAKTGCVTDGGTETKCGWNVSGLVTYDSLARTKASGMVQFSEAYSIEALLCDDKILVNPSFTEYDAKGRTVRSVLPVDSDGNAPESRTDYLITDGMARTVSKDPLRNITVQVSDARGNIVYMEKQNSHGEKLTSVNYSYDVIGQMLEAYNEDSTKPITVTYDLAGRMTRLASTDSGEKHFFLYSQDGERTNKYTLTSETLYFSKMWSCHTDAGNATEGGQTSKHIYLGDTRIVTKLNSGTNPTYSEEYNRQYYYHADLLGSAHLITDKDGNEYQRLEYTPYGEIWVEKTSNTGLQYLPYKFTGKEMDSETGLYYYGARYLDAKYSRWLSTDPALKDYVSKDYKGASGGIFNSVNLNLYHYGSNNPIKYSDPDGKEAYLLTWTTNSRHFGHSAFAVDNYDKNGICDGTVTFYELGPKNIVPAGREMENVDAYYGKKCINKDELFSENLSHFDSNKADGIIKFSTLPKTDAKTKTALDNFMTSSNVYNAESRNCSDMAKVGVQKSKNGFKFGLGKEHYLWHSFTTPNTLFNDSKEFDNSSILVDPGKKTNFSFKDYYVVPRVEAYKNRNTNDESLDYLFQ